MELNHSFTVPVGVDQAFEVLTDIERIAPCMPGASIDSVDGDEFTGKVKVKVGPMQVTYRGTAKYAELDRDNHSAVIEARAQEMRGSGTANATITADLTEKSAEETEVNVVSNLSITGRPAQFGRGVMNEVGAKLLGQFADCLATRLGGEDEEPEPEEPETDESAPAASVGSNGSSAAASEQEITRQVGAASPQPASGAAPAAAAAAPSAAAATSGATPARSEATTAGSETTETPAKRTTTPRQTAEEDVEAIDLFDVAGASVAKRAIPAAAVVLLLVLLIWRRRSRS
ncbi:MAG: SRPBCC family protein [Actinobacteria bacterium]|nr:SRPBCC family protein [Actinomycetota bacterium]